MHSSSIATICSNEEFKQRMNSVNTIEVPPRAGALTQSMRGMGYTLQTAVADIIDNSISAGAKTICLRTQNCIVFPMLPPDGCFED